MTAHQRLAPRLAIVLILFGTTTVLAANPQGCIQIDDKNPRYWQYKGQPVLLLGASKTDHIFLADELKEHLDEMAAVAANYVRSTMSQREGVDLKPHKRLPNGKFDLAGSATVRFHRPDSGIGLNDTAKACIRAARKAESRISLWEVRTAMNLLGSREADEAYLAFARPGEKYLLYFTDGGSVTLDLTGHSKTFNLRWINVSNGDWGQETTLKGGSKVDVSAPGKSGWVATIVRQ